MWASLNIPEEARLAMRYLMDSDVPCLIFQDKYSMFNRQPEQEILGLTREFGSGFIAFSPLAQGLLTDKYLHGIPEYSRAADPAGFLQREQVSSMLVEKVTKLNEVASNRGQSMAEMALSWALRDEGVTSLIVGARNVDQLEENLVALDNISFTQEELLQIDQILDGATL